MATAWAESNGKRVVVRIGREEFSLSPEDARELARTIAETAGPPTETPGQARERRGQGFRQYAPRYNFGARWDEDALRRLYEAGAMAEAAHMKGRGR